MRCDPWAAAANADPWLPRGNGGHGDPLGALAPEREVQVGGQLEFVLVDVPMTDRRGIEDLKELGAGRPAPADVARLYHQAFRDFGTQTLWSRKPSAEPTITQALVIAEGLRREGNMRSRPLAARIEEACRAAL